MSKETILKESYKSLIKYLDWNVDCEKEIKEIISKAIDQTREETIREVEQLIPERKDGGKNFDQWQYYCQGYNDLRDYILNKLKN